MDLIDLGLKFVPTPSKISVPDIKSAQHYIKRRIALFDYFSKYPHMKNTNPNPIANKFLPPNSWTPEPHQISSHTLESINKICEATQNICAGKIITPTPKNPPTNAPGGNTDKTKKPPLELLNIPENQI